MHIHTYRAATIREALDLVRRELGPDAALLQTRTVRNRWLGLWPGPQEIEVTASRAVNVPSRLPARVRAKRAARPAEGAKSSPGRQGQLRALEAVVNDRGRRSLGDGKNHWPDELLRLFTDLLDADLSEDAARELVEQVRRSLASRQKQPLGGRPAASSDSDLCEEMPVCGEKA